jgi:rhodanese-related sulfurtransferase
MVAVFFTFALFGPLPPKEMRVILGVAVLLDAALVRLLLLPVALRLVGAKAWYLPAWARCRPSSSATHDARHDHPSNTQEPDQMSTTDAATQHIQALERTPPRGEPMRVPTPLDGQPGRVLVDTTWGSIQPIRLHPEIETVGELELIEHLNAGLPVLDTRRAESYQAATIPGARSLSHTEIEQRLDELDRDTPAILFCNGPQCAATPHAIRVLLEHGHPARRLRYYRRGIHDWSRSGSPPAPRKRPVESPTTSRTSA